MTDPAFLLGLPLPALLFVLIAGVGRTLGALFGLWGLYFIIGAAPLLRVGLALVLSGPILVVSAPAFAEIVAGTDRVALLIVPVREFAIGFALGLLASLPFFAILGAAMLIDQYRGDFAPANPAPEGQQVGSFSVLKVVMSLFLFVEMGGFAMLITAIYLSYGALPPGPGGLGVGPGFGAALGGILQGVFVTLAIVALPIVLMLMLIEFGLNMAMRIAGQIKPPAFDFLLKNIALVFAMPVLVYGLARGIERAIAASPDPLPTLLRLLGS